MMTLAEFARAWHAEVARTSCTEEVGELLNLDRAVIEAPVTTREDLVALLTVCIADFRTQHDVAALTDPGDQLVWKAINAAHLVLQPA